MTSVTLERKSSPISNTAAQLAMAAIVTYQVLRLDELVARVVKKTR
jgi:hypothetical protein